MRRRYDPNQSHPIHGTQNNVSAPKQRTVVGGLPLDLMRMRMRDVQGGSGAGGLTPEFLNDVLNALRRRSNFNQQPFAYGTDVIRLRPLEERAYFFIVNTDPAANMFVGFGTTPNTTAGIPIVANFGFYEPFQVPQNEIYVVGSAAGTGVLITASLSLSGYVPTELSVSEE